MYYFKISSRSLVSKWRQYISLFLVSMVGVGISLFLMFVVDGMLSAMSTKAKIYYGGDFQIVGGIDGLNIDNSTSFIEKVKSVMPKDAVVSGRLFKRGADSFLCYEGTDARFRRMVGVDYKNEAQLFSRFNYVEGSAADAVESNSVLISEPIAKLLSVHAGDSITLVTERRKSGIDTIPLIVSGIFRDSSIFGMYTVYMDLDFLRDIDGVDPDYVNRCCIFFPNDHDVEKKINYYHKKLSSVINMYPVTDDRYKFIDILKDVGFQEPTYELLNISANMKELQIIIQAMKWVSLLVIFALVIIIIVGVSSTYRVLVMKRINEIGIYKAIGMNRFNVYRILMSETCCLMFAGCFSGLVLSLIMCFLVRFLNLSFIPAFDIFLTNGFIAPLVSLSNSFAVMAVIFVTTVLAVVLSIRKAVEITPVQALATTE
ncbi:MAG: FtsX-like permease family protein [Treponema sp.]|nr:FtsX-like permease family protein [Candidatus Treponema equi]